jgi:hypothetical protein
VLAGVRQGGEAIGTQGTLATSWVLGHSRRTGD